MVEFPQEVIDIVKQAALQHKDDIDEAHQCAERGVRGLKNFAELQELLVSDSIRELVYQSRHTENVRLRREAGQYGSPSRVDVANSEAVHQVNSSVYDYFIAGISLGMILGKELAGIAEREGKIAEGHQFNQRLCEALARMVPEESRVRDAVPEKKLRNLFKRLRQEYGRAA